MAIGFFLPTWNENFLRDSLKINGYEARSPFAVHRSPFTVHRSPEMVPES
jgi:hypothetical protein